MTNHEENRPQLYKVWINIKTRCYNPKATGYNNYGGRGIKLSNSWLDFRNFQQDMLPSYKVGLTIDRFDNNGNYSKENCRWATKSEQAFNRRKRNSELRSNNHFFEFMGISDTLTNWANFFGFNKSTLAMRIYKYGWSIDKTLTERNPYYGTAY